MLRMFVLMFLKLMLKLGHFGSKISQQAKSKAHFVNTLAETFFEAILMNLAQNVCLDDDF